MNHARVFFNLVLLLVVTVEVQAAKRPNVVIVMTDDQGYPEVSAHGKPVLQTPNLDALHSQSLRLTYFHGRRQSTVSLQLPQYLFLNRYHLTYQFPL